jgi:hypothetical protein
MDVVCTMRVLLCPRRPVTLLKSYIFRFCVYIMYYDLSFALGFRTRMQYERCTGVENLGISQRPVMSRV